MNKGEKQYQDAIRILGKWKDALDAMQTGNDRDRDSAILRFELAFEVIWKFIQERVRDNGFESNSPRQAFENAFRLGWIEDEYAFSEILKSRNTAVHVYREEYAEELAAKLNGFYTLFHALVLRCAQS